MKQSELSNILKLHQKWLKCEEDGVKANLHNADLRHANLGGADLNSADLNSADLSGADLTNAELNWVNWHEVHGIKVYVAGLQSSRENAQLVYIPSLGIATTGCFQDTWDNLKDRVKEVYKKDNPKIYKKYQLAIKYIEEQINLDKDETK